MPALLAATSLVAMPAQAAELPIPTAPAIAQPVAAAPAWAPGDDDAA
ncbi:MAG TPA: cell division protein ZapA, partial [Erythrobacter sp.]|nr:cell division protein ZapA [Erythrobacter sp.]